MEQNTKQNSKKTIGFFTLCMLVVGSMIGAGVFVVPNSMMSYGFGGTLGWILAAMCSLVLGRIFVDISLSMSGKGGLSAIVAREYGNQAGFISNLAQTIFITIGSSAITFALVSYLSEFCGITSNLTQFIIGASIVTGISLMHSFTMAGFQLLSSITILKIVLFGFCAVLGLVQFNPLKVFGFVPSMNLFDNFANIFDLNGGVLSLITGTLKASTVALFAFAGLESAASASNVKDPEKNVPKATIYGLVICSIIYFFTHICVVNASGTYSATPVKSALSNICGALFGEQIGVLAGGFVSIAAVLGCFGTLLALIYVVGSVLNNGVLMANPKFKTKISPTGFPIYLSGITVVGMILIMFAKYILQLDLDAFLSTSNFALVYFYLQCVLAHFRFSNNKFLSCLGFVAAFILFSGCNPVSVFIGAIILEVFGKVLFAVLEKPASTNNTILDASTEKTTKESPKTIKTSEVKNNSDKE